MSERDEILEEFAVEPVHDRGTLESYLRRWPQYATALIDLSREISRPIDASETAMPSEDIARLGRILSRSTPATSPRIVNPFAAMSVDMRNSLPGLLRVPATVVLAFRESRVILTTVPERFMRRFAEVVAMTYDDLRAGLAIPLPRPARAYKSDRKPIVGGQVSFEQILVEALVSEQDRAELLDPGA